MGEALVQSTVENAILHLVINRPDKRNALSSAVLAALKQTFTQAASDPALRAVVLRGAGDSAFAAGGDLRELEAVRTREGAAEMARHAKSALGAVRSCPVPVIAALNGDALGGGAELAVACDLRVAAAHARIGFIQGRLAITTAWGGACDLFRLLGPGRALELLARGEILSAVRARDIGLVNAVAEKGESLDQALDRFLEPIRAQAPQVLRAFKAFSLLHRQREREAADCLETERFSEVWMHPDHFAAADKVLAKRS